MRTLRKLLLGETWALPAGIVVALGLAVAIRALAGPDGWWRDVGGWLLFAALAVALGAAIGRPRRR
jgi:hypothetical protein